jgi:ribosomal protein L16 Arg81 hydroxylase
MRRLEEESRAKTKLLKRQGRQEECLAAEVEQLQDELAKTRLDLEANQTAFREAVQARDAQLAATEVQAQSAKAQAASLSADVQRLNGQLSTREKELTAAFDDRLHLELKQQQLRYERRLQVRCCVCFSGLQGELLVVMTLVQWCIDTL